MAERGAVRGVRAVVLKAKKTRLSQLKRVHQPKDDTQWLTAAPEASAAAPPDAIADGDMLLCP